MAGPTASILLRHPLTDEQKVSYQYLISVISTPMLSVGSDHDLWVTTTQPLGGHFVTYDVKRYRPFALEILPVEVYRLSEDFDFQPRIDYYDEQGMAEFEHAFGFRPAAAVVIVAYCNEDVDHQVLGELALWVSQTFEGVIDFNGRLYGNGKVPMSIDRVLASLPGIRAQCSHPTDREEQRNVGDYGDPTFLKAWMGHPAFRMVK